MSTNIMAATTITPQVLVAQTLAASETTQYTGPASSSVKITKAVLCNTSGANVTVSISLVKSGGTAGAANRLLASYSLVAGDSTVLDELTDQVLTAGDFVSALASTASVVALVMSGVVST